MLIPSAFDVWFVGLLTDALKHMMNIWPRIDFFLEYYSLRPHDVFEGRQRDKGGGRNLNAPLTSTEVAHEVTEGVS